MDRRAFSTDMISAAAESACTSSSNSRHNHPTSSPLWKAWLKAVNGIRMLCKSSSASSPERMDENTPTTVKLTPLMRIDPPMGDSALVNKMSRTRSPMTAIFRLSSMSRALMCRPSLSGLASMSCCSGNSPKTVNAPVFRPRVTLFDPRQPPSWFCGAATSNTRLLAARYSTSPIFKSMGRPR